mmetsp:Transcript_21168/g.53809  ORF Transcript_21168/g.53809 Transcript_21168/m.53809 type:complete len:233 (-) Transcript_21168:379-1077(-)
MRPAVNSETTFNESAVGLLLPRPSCCLTRATQGNTPSGSPPNQPQKQKGKTSIYSCSTAALLLPPRLLHRLPLQHRTQPRVHAHRLLQQGHRLPGAPCLQLQQPRRLHDARVGRVGGGAARQHRPARVPPRLLAHARQPRLLHLRVGDPRLAVARVRRQQRLKPGHSARVVPGARRLQRPLIHGRCICAGAAAAGAGASTPSGGCAGVPSSGSGGPTHIGMGVGAAWEGEGG